MPYTIYEKAGSDAAVAAALAALPPGGDSLPANAAGVLTNDGSGVLSWEAAPASSLDTEAVQDVVGAMVAAAGGTYDDAAGTITIPTNPPTAGASVVLVDNGDGTWTLISGGVDTTPPTPGTLAASAVTQTGLTLTVSGAADAGGLHATPYAFSIDGGGTWSQWQESATYAATGLAAGTTHSCLHRVRDAQGNEALGSAITQETAAGIAFGAMIAGTTAANMTTVAVDRSTATIGQLALVFIERAELTAPSTVPAGWTLLENVTTANYQASVYWKVLGPSDPVAHSWTYAAGAKTNCVAVLYSGAVGIAAHAATMTAAYSTTIPLGPLSTSSPWVVGIGCGYNTTDVALTASSEYVARGSNGNINTDLFALVADTNGAHPGGALAGAMTATPNVNNRAAFLIALS